jgi:hypothetical protein
MCSMEINSSCYNLILVMMTAIVDPRCLIPLRTQRLADEEDLQEALALGWVYDTAESSSCNGLDMIRCQELACNLCWLWL